MIVCKQCLQAIESHEGRVLHVPVLYLLDKGKDIKVVEVDGEECVYCEWCDEYVPVYDAVEI